MMSILLVAAAVEQQQPEELSGAVAVVIMVLWTLTSLAVLWKLQVFSADGLRGGGGEPRLAPDESLVNFAMILLAGLFTWIIVPAFYSAAKQSRSGGEAPTTVPTQPATTTSSVSLASNPQELIALSAAAGATALVMLLAGNALFRPPAALDRLGLRLRQFPPAVPMGVAGIVLIMPLIWWVGMMTMKLWDALRLEHDTKHEMLKILDQTNDPVLARLLVITAAIIAPVYEEVLFRGHLQTLLAHFVARIQRGRDAVMEAYAAPNAAIMGARIPSPSAKWIAIIITSLAFAVVHPWWTTPPIFFLSVCLGYAYERWNYLWLPIVMHGLFNATSIVISKYVAQ